MVWGRHAQMAVLLAVLDGRFDSVLYRGVHEVSRQIAGGVQVPLHDRTPDRLSGVLAQQDQVARREGSLSHSFEKSAGVADRDALAQQILQNPLDHGQGKLLGHQVLYYFGLFDGHQV